MDQLWYFLDGGYTRNSLFTPESVLLSLLVAFVLGQLLAWVYRWTHSGLSYSRSFVQSLVLMAVVVSLVMAVIGNSIITAFGLIGALSLVRFRNIIKDTRDVAFVFFSLVIGMAAGSQRYAVAVMGTAMLCAIVLYLYVTEFGSRRTYNAFLRFCLQGRLDPHHEVTTIMKRYCGGYSLVSMQAVDDGDTAEYAFQLVVHHGRANEEMAAALKAVPGVSDIHLTMQEELIEV